MPAKNVNKTLSPNQYYHVYNRGVAKQKIFIDESDKKYFLRLLDRYLNSANDQVDGAGITYKKFDKDLELLCYCLMGNHFHMMFYLGNDMTAMTEFMRRIGTAYTMYFNLKYKRVGPLFQGTYKASHITSDSYLLHISRYIHMNPSRYMTYRYSSLRSYLDGVNPAFLKVEKIHALFKRGTYASFLKEYVGAKRVLDDIKSSLANN